MAKIAKEKLLDLTAKLIAEGKAIPMESGTVSRWPDGIQFGKWYAGCRNLLRILGSHADPWQQSFQDATPKDDEDWKAMLGTLQAIEDALNDDLLFTVEQLIFAEAFADLLEQAEYLLSEGNYFLAAGVLGRAVLEEHLRKRCDKAGCAPAKAKPTINDFTASLYASAALDKIQMKHVEAMAAIGNDCAHNTGKATKGDVERLLRDVRDFLVKNPV